MGQPLRRATVFGQPTDGVSLRAYQTTTDDKGQFLLAQSARRYVQPAQRDKSRVLCSRVTARNGRRVWVRRSLSLRDSGLTIALEDCSAAQLLRERCRTTAVRWAQRSVAVNAACAWYERRADKCRIRGRESFQTDDRGVYLDLGTGSRRLRGVGGGQVGQYQGSCGPFQKPRCNGRDRQLQPGAGAVRRLATPGAAVAPPPSPDGRSDACLLSRDHRSQRLRRW